jgi:hypothetical protein
MSTLASVYFKPPETFVSRQRLAVTKAEDMAAIQFDEEAEAGAAAAAVVVGPCNCFGCGRALSLS